MSVVLFQSAMVWVVCPIMVFYYESNDKLRVYERIKRAIKIQLPRFLFIILFTVITAFLSRESTIPYEYAEKTFNRAGRIIVKEGTNEKFMVITTNVAEHFMICTTYIGFICFILFAGVGLVALPWDMFVDYTYRPKPIDETNFADRKQLLLLYSLELRDFGKKLDENHNYVQ